MNTLGDLREFYNSKLLPELTDLEQKRIKIVKKLTSVGISIASVILVVVAYYFNQIDAKENLIVVPLILGGLIFSGFYYHYTK